MSAVSDAAVCVQGEGTSWADCVQPSAVQGDAHRQTGACAAGGAAGDLLWSHLLRVPCVGWPAHDSPSGAAAGAGLHCRAACWPQPSQLQVDSQTLGTYPCDTFCLVCWSEEYLCVCHGGKQTLASRHLDAEACQVAVAWVIACLFQSEGCWGMSYAWHCLQEEASEDAKSFGRWPVL